MFPRLSSLSIPSIVHIGGVGINSFGIFVLIGFVLLAFEIWNEGRGDGFDEDKLFDLLLISTASSVFFSRMFYAISIHIKIMPMIEHIFRFWTAGYNVSGALLGFLLALVIACKNYRWSIYRILDIFSLGLSLALSVISLGYVGLQGKFEFLFTFSCWIFVFAILSKFRSSKSKSGYVFSFFLLFNIPILYAFFNEAIDLIFYFLLFTLALVVFALRLFVSRSEVGIIKRFFKKTKRQARKKA